MEPCVSPSGHDWKSVSFTSAAGSTPVACAREGCDEIGYRIDPAHVVARDLGQNDERLF